MKRLPQFNRRSEGKIDGDQIIDGAHDSRPVTLEELGVEHRRLVNLILASVRFIDPENVLIDRVLRGDDHADHSGLLIDFIARKFTAGAGHALEPARLRDGRFDLVPIEVAYLMRASIEGRIGRSRRGLGMA